MLRAANNRQQAGSGRVAFSGRGPPPPEIERSTSITTSYQSAKDVVFGRVDVCQTAFGGGDCTKRLEIYARQRKPVDLRLACTTRGSGAFCAR